MENHKKGIARCKAGVFAILIALAMLVVSLGFAEVAQAQVVYIDGPLAGAPAVRNMRQYRDGRVQIRPFFGATLQDEYATALLFGLQAGYYYTDWIGLDLTFAYGAIQLETDLTNEVGSKGQTTDVNALSLPSREGFSNQIGSIDWMAAAQVTFIPLRGKLSLFQKLFVDSDFYIFGGVAAVGVDERASLAGASAGVCSTAPPVGADPANDPCLASQSERSSRIAIAPTFGFGLTTYFNDWAGLFFEWRGLPFAWNTSGTDEKGNGGDFPDGELDSTDRIFHFNHMMMIGATFALPTTAEVTK